MFLVGLATSTSLCWGQNETPANRRNRINMQSPLGDQQDPSKQVWGNVLVEGGGTPSRPVEIYYCGRQVALTDRKGRYSFSLGGARPSLGGGGARIGAEEFGRCVVTGRLDGYQADAVDLLRSHNDPSEGIRLLPITLYPKPGYDGLTTSVTTLEAPKAAQRALYKGLEEAGNPRGKPDKAAAALEKAVQLHPLMAEAWAALGEVRLKQRDLPGAKLALENAVASDPAFPQPYPVLVRIHMQEQDWARAAERAEAYLRFDSSSGEITYFHALASFQLGDRPAAEQSASSLIEKGLAPAFPQAHQILALLQAEREEYGPAAENLRTYLSLAPNADSAAQIREQLAKWERTGLVAPPKSDPPIQ